jgi:hypothetical protein
LASWSKRVDLWRLGWPVLTGGFSGEGCALERWKDIYVISLFYDVCWLRVRIVSVILLFHFFNRVPLIKKHMFEMKREEAAVPDQEELDF